MDPSPYATESGAVALTPLPVAKVCIVNVGAAFAVMRVHFELGNQLTSGMRWREWQTNE